MRRSGLSGRGRLAIAALSLLLALSAIPLSGFAHSLEWVEKNIAGKGRFFQPVHQKMPDFLLQDSKGRVVGPGSFAGKIVVLFVTGKGCGNACERQLARMAELREMVNITPMRDVVLFVAVASQRDSNAAKSDKGNWLAVTGSDQQIAALQKAFGPSDITQPVAHVIGSKGKWQADFVGVKFQLVNFLVYLNALQNDLNGIKDGHGK